MPPCPQARALPSENTLTPRRTGNGDIDSCLLAPKMRLASSHPFVEPADNGPEEEPVHGCVLERSRPCLPSPPVTLPGKNLAVKPEETNRRRDRRLVTFPTQQRPESLEINTGELYASGKPPQRRCLHHPADLQRGPEALEGIGDDPEPEDSTALIHRGGIKLKI